MEAQICKILMEFCNRVLRDAFMDLESLKDRGIRLVKDPDKEPWLTCDYDNSYYTTLKEVVLLLRNLYRYW
jgi:hypothetical protein